MYIHLLVQRGLRTLNGRNHDIFGRVHAVNELKNLYEMCASRQAVDTTNTPRVVHAESSTRLE